MSLRSYQARWIVPVSTPPIDFGWVQTDGSRVLQMGKGRCPHPHEDLGDVAILPQLVNAHTHLEFSSLRKPVGTRNISLAQWIGLVIASRDTTVSREDAIQLGLAESSQAGVSLIGEITTPPTHYPRNAGDPLLACFAEVLGLSTARSEERFAAAIKQTDCDPWCGLSPHAPYSTTRETIRRCVDLSRATGRSLAMHVAESPAERELLQYGRGAFFESLTNLGVLQDGLFPWGENPFHWLIDELSRASRVLLIHGNDLNAEEIAKLTPHHHLTVVYCPRTHAFFGYEDHPVSQMLRAGVRVALGTDSRASNPDLSVWSEVQYLLNHRPDLDPQAVVAMATQCGADALGYPKLGRIEVGCDVRFGMVETSATSMDSLHRDWAENEFRPLV